MRFGRRKDATGKPWLSAKLLMASSVAAVIGFSAICASVMLDMRARRGSNWRARPWKTSRHGLDADISRNFEIYDLSLRAVRQQHGC